MVDSDRHPTPVVESRTREEQAEAQQVSYSQFGEDLVIRAILQTHRKIEGGFFVDVGAFDPWRYSNTALLHLHHGWRGLNIDANADAIDRFLEQRPEDQSVRTLVGESNATREYVRFDHPGVNSADPEMIALQTRDGSPYMAIGAETVVEQALSEIIGPWLPRDDRPTLLSVDIEGMDLPALRSNDWEAFRPFLVVVETHGMTLGAPGGNDVFRFLTELGYQFVSHVFVTSIFMDTRPPQTPTPDVELQSASPGADLQGRYRAAIWESTTPVTDLWSLAAEIESDPSGTDFQSVMVLGQTVVQLNDLTRLAVARERLRLHEGNPWSRYVLAELDRVAGEHAVAQDRLVSELRNVEALPEPLLEMWAAFAVHSWVDLPPHMRRIVASTRYGDEHPIEWAFGEALSPERQKAFSAVIAARGGLTEERADHVVAFLVGEEEQGRSAGCSSSSWHAVDSLSAAWLEALEMRVHEALDERVGFAFVRLGDGEGVMLEGARADLGGALGRDALGNLEVLEDEPYARFRSTFLESISSVDVVGVPDLGQCMTGPSDSVKAVIACLEGGVPESVLAAGASHGHWGLEASGVMSRLARLTTGVIGPIDPANMANVGLPRGIKWLRIPGEAHYYATGSRRDSHLEGYFPHIMGHDFRPGQLWLVGGGMLGKLYCARVRAAGGVALDVGSLLDLWAGRQDTRGELRLNPWLGVPYLCLAPGSRTEEGFGIAGTEET
jgi:hypothetical protein